MAAPADYLMFVLGLPCFNAFCLMLCINVVKNKKQLDFIAKHNRLSKVENFHKNPGMTLERITDSPSVQC